MGKKRRSEPADEDEWGAGARALAAEQEAGAGIAHREELCRQHLEALNKQFAEWVNAQLTSRPVKSWASGSKDYLKHIDKIKADFKDVLESSTPPGSSTKAATQRLDPATTQFTMPTQQPAPTLFASLPTDTKQAPTANSTPPLSSGNNSMPLFPSADANPFASTPASAATPFGSAPGAPAFGGLFANAKPAFDLSAPTAIEQAEQDEEPQRPPSPSFQEKGQVDNDVEEVLIKVKCKFFTKKETNDPWADHGVNQLEFRKEKEPGEGNIRRSRLVCRNSIGKAVMNAGLYARMSVQVTEKKSPDGSVKKTGIIVHLFNAVEDSVKQITLIRLGNEDDVLNLKKLFEENIAEMSQE